LSIKWAPWKRVLITRTIAIVPAMVVAILTSKSLDVLDEWLNVLQSVQLPFALIPVLLFTMDRSLIGQFTNQLWLTVICWIIAIIVMVTNVMLIISFTVSDDFPSSLKNPLFYTFLALLGASYFSFIGYMIGWKHLDKWWQRIRGTRETNPTSADGASIQ